MAQYVLMVSVQVATESWCLAVTHWLVFIDSTLQNIDDSAKDIRNNMHNLYAKMQNKLWIRELDIARWRLGSTEASLLRIMHFKSTKHKIFWLLEYRLLFESPVGYHPRLYSYWTKQCATKSYNTDGSVSQIACGRWCRCASRSSTCSPHHRDLVPDNPVASSRTNFLFDICEGMKRKLCTPTSWNTFSMSEVQTELFSLNYIFSSNICFKTNFGRTVGEMWIYPQYLEHITCQLSPTNTLRIKSKWIFSPLKPVTRIRIMRTKKMRQQNWSSEVLHPTH
jgi:hypothetical protein